MKKFLSLTILICLLLSSCSSGGEQNAIRYDLTQAPSSLDPQNIQGESDLLVSFNIFEGLTSLSPTGEPRPACAESWTLSPDKMTYTFTLREGLLWENGASMEGSDFVYGLQRFLSSELIGINKSRYSAIEQVSAPSAQRVIIQLNRPDASLPALLAEMPAMPCSRSFFELQKGRYGLSATAILSNGPFSVYSWDSEMVVLTPNPYYRSPPTVSRVYLPINRGDPVDLFLQQRSEVCIVPYQRLSDLEISSGLPILDQTWVLLINPKGSVGESPALREALLATLDLTALHQRLPQEVVPAQGLIPSTAMLAGEFYRPLAGSPTSTTPTNETRPLFMDALASLGQTKLPRTTLLVSDFDPASQLGGAMQRMWSDSLSAHINMEQLSLNALAGRVFSGDFDIALVPMLSLGSHPEDYLSRVDHYPISIDGQSTTVAEHLHQLRQQESNPSDSAKAYLQIEQALIDQFFVLPIYTAPSLFVQSSQVRGVEYCLPQRTISFSKATYQ